MNTPTRLQSSCRIWQVSSLICLLTLGLNSCREKKTPDATSSVPTAPTTEQAVPKSSSSAVKTAYKRTHLDWPVEIRIDKNRMAIPPLVSAIRAPHEWNQAPMDMTPSSTALYFVANPTKITKGADGTMRQPFKHIIREPKTSGKKGQPSKEQLSPEGGRTEINGDTGVVQHWNKDGTSSTWDPGKGTFTYSDTDGSTTQVDVTNGGSVTYDKDGGTITHNPDGSVDIRNEDGSGAHLNGPNGPEGEIGTSFGPGGPENGTSTQFDDGDSIDIPAPTYGEPPPDGKLPDDGSGGPGSDKLAESTDDPDGAGDNPVNSKGDSAPNGDGATNGDGASDEDGAPDGDEGNSIDSPPPADGEAPPGSADPEKNLGPSDGSLPNDGSGGPGSDRMAGGAGDPHYITRDGTGYTSQAVGEFVLATGSKGRAMQARQQPWNGSDSISSITALAFLVNETRIEVRLDGDVLMNGTPVPVYPMGQADIPGGGVLGVWRSDNKLVSVVIVWPDLSTAWVSAHEKWLDFTLQWRGASPEQHGLLGSNDGDASNDLTDRSDKVANPLTDKEVAAFVHSWRVTDAESLFTYAAGESTATYTQLDFPKESAPFTPTSLATESCRDMPEGFAKKCCLYDISMTGDISFVASYVDLGKRLLGSIIHAAKASKRAKVVKAKMPPTATKPVVGTGEGVLTEAERIGATKVEVTAAFNETLKAGESKVYTFEFNDPNTTRLGVLSNQLDVEQAYSPAVAGYALFDKDGKLVGKIKSAVNDTPMMELKQGAYFLKIMGPGTIDIKLN